MLILKTRFYKTGFVALACLSMFFPSLALSQDAQQTPSVGEQPQEDRARFEPGHDLDRTTLNQITAEWLEEQRTTMDKLIEKYGPPNEGTQNYLIWNDQGPFARIILGAETDEHNFPVPHEDFLEQTVKYKVPVDRHNALTRLSGSLNADRTRGELSNRGNSEEMNILALNLAHDVASGERRVEDARSFYAQTARELERGETPEYTRELRFSADQEGTQDPDQAFESQEQQQRQP